MIISIRDGGQLKMARNLIQEKREAEMKKKNEKKKEEEQQQQEIKKEDYSIVTYEQVTLNNINVILDQLDRLEALMIEGFKQVGVSFEENKEETTKDKKN